MKGNPSTDPNDLYGPLQGAILPFGGIVGHKGFALSMIIDILSGGLSGAGCSRADATQIGNAMLITVYHVGHFASTEVFYQQVNDFVQDVKFSELAPGFDEIMVPGEPEVRIGVKRRVEGIFVEEETWRQILMSAERLGVQFEDGELRQQT